MKDFSEDAVKVAFGVGSAIFQLVLDAIKNNDPKTLKKVTDVLPSGDPMKTRLALILEEEKLRR